MDVLSGEVEEQGIALVMIRDDALGLQGVHLAGVGPVVLRVDVKVLPEVVGCDRGLCLVCAEMLYVKEHSPQSSFAPQHSSCMSSTVLNHAIGPIANTSRSDGLTQNEKRLTLWSLKITQCKRAPVSCSRVHDAQEALEAPLVWEEFLFAPAEMPPERLEHLLRNPPGMDNDLTFQACDSCS